jgi:DNA-binding transcriptional ArsR family regulator
MGVKPVGTVERRLEEVRRFLHTVIERPDLLDAFSEDVYVPMGVNVSSLFAPARLELLRTIGRERLTVGQLAKRLHRRVPSVSRDLTILERRGLLRFEVRGKRKIPELRRTLIVLPLAGPPAKASRRVMRAFPATTPCVFG